MQKTAIVEVHPIELLTPGTVRAVGLALGISRQLATQRLRNMDDEAWGHAKRIEEERKAKREETAAQIRAIQNGTSATTHVPQ